MKNEHTPAPWTIQHGHSSRVYLIDNPKGHALGEIVYSDTRNPADAQLIAAAPELLQALRGMLQLFADTTDMEDYETVQFARAALAHADHGQVAAEGSVFTKHGWNGHSALLVRNFIGGAA